MENVIFVTDIGKDPDDVLALVALLNMHAQHEINVLGIVTNCGNAATTKKRAAFVSGIIKERSLNIPVCAGTGNNEHGNVGEHANFFVNSIASKKYVTSAEKIETNVSSFLKNITSNVSHFSFIVCAGFTDVKNFCIEHEQSAKNKLQSLFIMGNGKVINNKVFPDDRSYNNSIDIVSAKMVYDFANNNNINTFFMPSYAVKTAPVNMQFYNKIKNKNTPIFNYLFAVQKKAFKQHYKTAKHNKNKLSDKYNLEWFLRNFTNLTTVKKYCFNTVWKHTTKLYLYDPFTVLIVPQELRKKYFENNNTGNINFLIPKNATEIIDVLLSKL